jgi:hypothetical protein
MRLICIRNAFRILVAQIHIQPVTHTLAETQGGRDVRVWLVSVVELQLEHADSIGKTLLYQISRKSVHVSSADSSQALFVTRMSKRSLPPPFHKPKATSIT